MALAEIEPISPVRKDRFHWSKLQTWQDLQTLGDVYRDLPQLDRAVYATMGTVASNPHGTGNFVGDAARIMGAQDIEDFYIGICGNDQPMRSEQSETASKKRDDIESTLIDQLTARGIAMGEEWRGRKKLSEMFYALSEIATRDLPEEPLASNPEWKSRHRLGNETFWTWLVEDTTLPDEPPYQLNQ